MPSHTQISSHKINPNYVIVTLLAKALIAIKQYDYFSNSQEELHELYDLIVAEETRNPDAILILL